jgi:hypothetical protein
MICSLTTSSSYKTLARSAFFYIGFSLRPVLVIFLCHFSPLNPAEKEENLGGVFCNLSSWQPKKSAVLQLSLGVVGN